MALDRHFGSMQRQPLDRTLEPQPLRNVAEQLLDRSGADDPQHVAAVGVGERQITHQSGFLMMKRRRT